MADYIGIVNTTSGKVSGIEMKDRYEGITTFRGIPFAAPPVGELRWRPPEDPQTWQGVRCCYSDGPACVQPTNGELDEEPWATDFYFMGNQPMSEDCLYLSVTTGASAAGEKRPVFMWFHGGGLDHGYSYEIEFDPRELARKGIVVVSVAQRLNVFGYMALPQLTAEQGKSGNYILMDDIKALEWVVNNIDAFGGDPDCITVGGQSAGTGKCAALSFSPYGRKHIKRVINDSGLAWTWVNHTQEEMEKSYQDYLAQMGFDPNAPIEELRKIDAFALLPHAGVSLPGGLVCDGDIVPDIKQTDSMARYGVNYDYLAGSNLGEMPMDPSKGRGEINFHTAADFYAYSRKLLGDLYDKYDFENLVPVTDENVEYNARRLASYGLNGSGQANGTIFNRYFGAWRSKTAPDKNTFIFLFDHPTPGRPEDEGTIRDPKNLMSWHSSELWYNFASLRDGIPPARPWTEADFSLAEMMNQYWVNFIKTGDPNGEGLPEWPKSDAGYGYAELDNEVRAFRGRNKLDDLIWEFIDRDNRWPV